MDFSNDSKYLKSILFSFCIFVFLALFTIKTYAFTNNEGIYSYVYGDNFTYDNDTKRDYFADFLKPKQPASIKQGYLVLTSDAIISLFRLDSGGYIPSNYFNWASSSYSGSSDADIKDKYSSIFASSSFSSTLNYGEMSVLVDLNYTYIFNKLNLNVNMDPNKPIIYSKNYFLTVFNGTSEEFVNQFPKSQEYNPQEYFYDNNGNLTQIRDTVYDLEAPLNLKVKQKSLIDLKFVELGKDETLYFAWEQDDPNHKNWITEVYVQVNGTTKKYWYSLKNDKFFIDWMFCDDVPTYKLKYTFDVSKSKLIEKAIESQNGEYFSAKSKASFMFRNSYFDETTKIQHYSNYIYLDNSTLSTPGSSENLNGYEIDGATWDNSDKSDDSFNNSIVGDSDLYDGSSVIDEGNSATSALSIIKGVLNDVKQAPAFFSDVLSFLPSTFFDIFAAALILLIGIAIVKLVV